MMQGWISGILLFLLPVMITPYLHQPDSAKNKEEALCPFMPSTKYLISTYGAPSIVLDIGDTAALTVIVHVGS